MRRSKVVEWRAMSTIVLEVTDHVARITIDRPERMNAFDIDTHEAFAAAIDRVESDDDIRVAVITGAGQRAFCAGRDLKWTAEISSSPEEVRAEADRRMAALTRLQFRFDITKPLIARLNGVALGAGSSWRWPATSSSPLTMLRWGCPRPAAD